MLNGVGTNISMAYTSKYNNKSINCPLCQGHFELV